MVPGVRPATAGLVSFWRASSRKGAQPGKARVLAWMDRMDGIGCRGMLTPMRACFGRKLSEAGFAGFYDWSGLGEFQRGTVPILIIPKS